MRETAPVGHRKTLAALVFGLVLSFLLLLPAEASAQFTPVPGIGDFCSEYSTKSPKDRTPGRFRASPFRTYLSVNVAGGGAVDPSLYQTAAQCVFPDQNCSASCSYEVQTVCEFHCSHDHTAPYHWELQLAPIEGPGAYLLGWIVDAGAGTCLGIKDAARDACLVKMNTNHTVTAHFGQSPDPTPPTVPALTATAGSYSVALSWTPSNDQWLAGYEIFKDGILSARAPKNASSFQVQNVFCESNHTFQVKAYDSTGNEASSAPVAVRTGACGATSAPRPNTVIHIKPPRSTRSRTAFFHFGTRGTLRATRYQCKLDRGRWRKCSGRLGKRYRGLKPGWHAFRVRAGNANGFDRTPAKHTWRVRR
jgi:hypothetical protein